MRIGQITFDQPQITGDQALDIILQINRANDRAQELMQAEADRLSASGMSPDDVAPTVFGRIGDFLSAAYAEFGMEVR